MKRLIIMLALSVSAATAIAEQHTTANYNDATGELVIQEVSVNEGKDTYSVTLQKRADSLIGWVFDLDTQTVSLNSPQESFGAALASDPATQIIFEASATANARIANCASVTQTIATDLQVSCFTSWKFDLATNVIPTQGYHTTIDGLTTCYPHAAYDQTTSNVVPATGKSGCSFKLSDSDLYCKIDSIDNPGGAIATTSAECQYDTTYQHAPSNVWIHKDPIFQNAFAGYVVLPYAYLPKTEDIVLPPITYVSKDSIIWVAPCGDSNPTCTDRIGYPQFTSPLP